MNAMTLDPALFIWCPVDFAAQEHKYWELAEKVMDIFSFIDDVDASIIVRTQLLEIIVEQFPADTMYSRTSELRDFADALFGYIARWQEISLEYPDAVINEFSPLICDRTYFGEDVISEIHSALHFLISQESGKYLLTDNLVFETTEEDLKLTVGETIYEVKMLLTGENYTEYKNSLKKFYRSSKKHDPFWGFGTRLPKHLTTDHLQELLDNSVRIKDKNCWCVYSIDEKSIFVFRGEEKNFYHGYPIPEGELNRLGIGWGGVPEVRFSDQQ